MRQTRMRACAGLLASGYRQRVARPRCLLAETLNKNPAHEQGFRSSRYRECPLSLAPERSGFACQHIY